MSLPPASLDCFLLLVLQVRLGRLSSLKIGRMSNQRCANRVRWQLEERLILTMPLWYVIGITFNYYFWELGKIWSYKAFFVWGSQIFFFCLFACVLINRCILLLHHLFLFQDEYMSLPGLFPTVAGKIASHGPYNSVKDMYNIEGLTARDKKMMQKYESEFTVNPASLRTFNERINARVST